MALMNTSYVYSDRIVQDFHLIPYYPSDASMGTEKLFLEYNSVL